MHHVETTHSAGLSSDFGWGDAEARGLGSLGSAILVIASGLYCASLWVAGGLPPLAHLASGTVAASRCRRCHARHISEGAEGQNEYR